VRNKEKQRKVVLVVLAWNKWDLTRKCLTTLKGTDIGDAEVLVVDNGSTDETPEQLEKLEGIRTLSLKENLGFVRGNNAALDVIDPHSDVVLLNNDMEFYQRDWLKKLQSCAYSEADIGIVGCRLVRQDGSLVHTGTFIMPDTMWGQQNEHGGAEKNINQYSTQREVEGIVFACAYIKREVIQKIGGLSTDYESYFEDTDYCLRAKREGYKTVVCGQVTLTHNEHGSTRDDSERHMSLFMNSRKIFSKKWKSFLTERYSSEIGWQSIMNFPTGYAMSCREYIRGLEKKGVRVFYDYAYGPGTPFPIEEPEDSLDYRLNVVRSRKFPSETQYAVVYGQGDVFKRNKGEYKVGFTMLEVDGFPKEWVAQANLMDEVWVPSEFNKQAFLDCGLKKPVYKIPLGVDTNYFSPDVTGYPSPFGEFLFLSNFEWGERKEPWMLLKTFNETFRHHEDVRLLVKINNRDPSINLFNEINNLKLDPRGGKISYLINYEFPHYQLASLYRSADCYISAGRGEGWDMPLMEAMACGLPSIATDWGAHNEFVNDRISYLLRIRGTVPAVAKCPYYSGFSWADPDPEHLAFLLRHVVENREEAKKCGNRAALEMAKNWSWDSAIEKILERRKHSPI